MYFIIFCHILRDIFEKIIYYYSVKELSSQVWQVLQFHISLSSIKFTKLNNFNIKWHASCDGTVIELCRFIYPIQTPICTCV